MFASQLIYMVSNAVLILLLTRYLLEPSEFGLLQFALSVLGVVAIFGNLGIPKSTAKHVTEYLEQDATQVRYIIRRSLVYVVTLSVVTGLVLGLASDTVAEFLGEPGLTPLLLVGIGYVAFKAFSGHLSSIFQGFNRVTWSATVNALSGVGRTVFAVVFVLLGFGALGVMLGYVAGFLLATGVGLVVLYTKFYSQFAETTTPEPGLSNRMLRYSVPLTAAKGADVLDNKVDSILIGALLNPTAVGFYIIAMQVAVFVTVPATAFGYTMSPTLGEQKARDSISVASRLYEESLSYVLLVFVPAAVGIALIAGPLIELLFGAAYLPATPVLQVLSLFVLIHSINTITSSGLDYLGQANNRAAAKIVMALTNVVLNIILIPVLGITGAALATVVTYGGYTLANVYFIHRELQLRVGHVLRKAAVVTAITAVMAGAVVSLLPLVSGLPSLLGVVFVGGVVWAVLAVASGALDVRQLVRVLQ